MIDGNLEKQAPLKFKTHFWDSGINVLKNAKRFGRLFYPISLALSGIVWPIGLVLSLAFVLVAKHFFELDELFLGKEFIYFHSISTLSKVLTSVFIPLLALYGAYIVHYKDSHQGKEVSLKHFGQSLIKPNLANYLIVVFILLIINLLLYKDIYNLNASIAGGYIELNETSLGNYGLMQWINNAAQFFRANLVYLLSVLLVLSIKDKISIGSIKKNMTRILVGITLAFFMDCLFFGVLNEFTALVTSLFNVLFSAGKIGGFFLMVVNLLFASVFFVLMSQCLVVPFGEFNNLIDEGDSLLEVMD